MTNPQITVDVDRLPIVLKVMGGPQGPKGDKADIFIKGVASAWPPASHPDVGDLYVIPPQVPVGVPVWAKPNHGAFWDGHDWVDSGPLQGPRGVDGPPGPPLSIRGVASAWVPDSAPKPGDVWILPDPLPVGTPAGFTAGGAAAWDGTGSKWVPLQAIRGPAGRSVQVFGPSATPPIGVPLYKGDIWLSTDPTLFSPTFDPSTVVPAPGPAGPPGPAGASAYETWKTIVGRPTAAMSDYLDAIKGAPGAAGARGPAGETLTVQGVVPDESHLPATPPNLTVYMTKDGTLFIYNPTSSAAATNGWVNLGKIAGPAGQPATMTPAVATDADRPAAGLPGQMVYVTATGHLWGWDDVGKAWIDGGKFGVGAGSVDDGTHQGAILVWDDMTKRWVSADFPVPVGTADGDSVRWDATTSAWKAVPPTLDDNDDVSYTTSPMPGDALVWMADHWEPGTPNISVDELTDTNLPADMANHDGEGLSWDQASMRWKPAPFVSSDKFTAHETFTTLGIGRNAPLRATITAEPTSPPKPGIAYIVGPGATGEFAGHDNAVAIRTPGGSWLFEQPIVGHVHWHDQRREFVNWNGTDWSAVHLEEYERTTTHAGMVRDVNGRVFGIGGANSATETGATLEFLYDPNTPSTASTKIVLHDCSAIDFSQAGTIRGIADPTENDEVANKKYVDEKIAAVVTGMAHGVAVEEITNTPPTAMLDGNAYIVGTSPTGAWADKANQVATVHAGAWVFTAPTRGDTHLVEKDGASYSWSGTAWVKTADKTTAAVGDGMPVGSVLMWLTGSVPANYLELNGSRFDAMAYPDLYRALGTDILPDLRGQFVRGAGPGHAALTRQGWTTGRPRTAFTTDNPGNHTHGHGAGGEIKSDGAPNWLSGRGLADTLPAGAHTHMITGGGDAETAPDHVYVVYIIKAKV